VQWLELSIRVPWELVEPISYLFNRHGSGFSIEDLEEDNALIRTYVPSNSRKKLVSIEIGARLVSHLAPKSQLLVKELKQEDWETAWKAHYSLLKIGRKIVIRPSWIGYKPMDGEVMVSLDPGMAFGTGYHPTTRLCLRALEDRIKPGVAVLDLGTGSGILAITAALLGADPVLAIDKDPIAVKVARVNCKINDVQGRMRLRSGGLPHSLVGCQEFDLVVANISAKTIKENASLVLDALRPGGVLVASGLLRQQEDDVANRLGEVGFTNINFQHLEDWASIEACSPS
jgi:ribosomal protein L11 methyltransferase